MFKLVSYARRFVRAFGVRQGAAALMATYGPRRGLLSVPCGSLGRVWLRDNPADRFVFRQVFVDRDYDTGGWRQDAWVRRRYDAIVAAGRVPVIVDAGANIGLASVWFSGLFPLATVYAVEPDPENLSVLARNAADRPIVPLAGAIWDRPARLGIANPDAASDAFRVVEGQGDLRAWSIDEVCRLEPRGDLFIVKIDIEGGERALFRGEAAWMAAPALIVMEPHDWLFPGEHVSRGFRQRIADLPIDLVMRGENLFCFASGPPGTAPQP